MQAAGLLHLRYDADAFIVYLERRNDDGGNPALTYRLTSCEIFTFEKLFAMRPSICEQWQQITPTLEDEAQRISAIVGRPVRHLLVCFVIDEQRAQPVAMPIIDQALPETSQDAVRVVDGNSMDGCPFFTCVSRWA